AAAVNQTHYSHPPPSFLIVLTLAPTKQYQHVVSDLTALALSHLRYPALDLALVLRHLHYRQHALVTVWPLRWPPPIRSAECDRVIANLDSTYVQPLLAFAHQDHPLKRLIACPY